MKYNKNEVTGKMRDRIILQNVTRSRSLTGFASESWSDTTTIWAFAESKLPGSNENIIDGKNTAKNVCDFTIRYISTISEESRVIWGDKLYQVKNIKVSHDRRFIFFQGVFYDSYILTGVNVAASVSGIATSTANIKLLMSVIGQANAIASAIGEITTAQQGVVEVASSVVANGTSTANITKVISIDSSIAASANVSAAATIVQYIATSVNAEGTSIANALVSKTLNANVQGNATATSVLDVISQGVTSVDAFVTATGTVAGDILRIATIESSSSTAADTTAIATLTKVLEASAIATAQTSSDALLTLAVNASATATAITTADAQLSYTVNAAADATAETNADAFITRTISAEATATANSSAEAGVGVTFVAAVVATATSTNADLFRTATMEATATASGSITAASITTVDNVAASVNGAATVNATLDVKEFILNKYPNAAAAYSLRKLRQAYTGNAIKVRRSSDNTEQDIGFDVNDNLDTSSLTSFCGAGNGFVTTWYDQSGNNNNLSQSTQANQPLIVNSGNIITLNGKVTTLFDGTNDFLDATGVTTGNPKSIFTTTKFNSIPTGEVVLFDSVSTNQCILLKSNANTMNLGFGTVALLINTPSTNYILYSILQNSTASNVYVNSSQVLTNTNIGSNAFNGLRLSAVRGTAGLFYNGNFSEYIIYDSNKSTDRTAIESNINTYYGIY